MKGPQKLARCALLISEMQAHVILEEPYPWLPPDYAAYNSSIDQSPVANPNEELILPISTTKQRSLKTQVEHIKRFWSQRISIDDLAYTLGCRRTHMLERGFIISSQSTLEQDLNPENLIVKKQPNGVVDAPWAFVFTGQGAQWPQMGKQLIEQSPIFRRTIRDLDDILSRLPHAPKWSLLGSIIQYFTGFLELGANNCRCSSQAIRNQQDQ